MFGQDVSVRYVDLYSAEVSSFPDIAHMLIRQDVPMPIIKIDDDDPLFGGSSFPRLVAMLEARGLTRKHLS